MYDSFVVWAMSQSEGYSANLDELSWSDVVDEAVSISQPIADMKSISIAVTGDETIEMSTDRMAANLVLRNLLSNAIKYSHEGSKIEVHFEKKGDQVCTTVQDWGLGISEELLGKIFHSIGSSRQGTRKEYGSGLGLRLIIQFIDLMGGTVTAESEEGKGSSFIVHLPLHQLT